MATATPNLTVQNWYATTLSSGISATDTTIPLNVVPTGVEGYLIIEPDSSTNRECIYYTSKTGSGVILPSVAAGRGVDGTTGISHASGSTVRMEITSSYWKALQDGSGLNAGALGGTPFASGWVSSALPAVSSVTANGNRSYSVTFASTIAATVSPGQRLRLTRTVTAPTQCTSLNGTTQYYSRTSAGLGSTMTFTDDFVVSAWVKLSSYPTSNIGVIASRYNGTSGWEFRLNTSGQLALQGFNTGAANSSYVQSYQSIPLNKWVHVSAQLDMSTFTATTTTSYVMFDGVDVPATVGRAGTNPTALIQAGNLEIGAENGGAATTFFPGKIAQVAIYNAKVTQATILASMNQTLSGSETSLISAYSFNNTINDLNANANNLTANGSAVATNADSPFGVDANGTPGVYDYGIVTKVATTVATVQVPEANTIPTSGGVSAVDLSAWKAPYGFPAQRGKWTILYINKTIQNVASPVPGTWYCANTNGLQTGPFPIGEWRATVKGVTQANGAAASDIYLTLSTSSSSESDPSTSSRIYASSAGISIYGLYNVFTSISLSASTTYYLLIKTGTASMTGIAVDGAQGATLIEFECAYL